MICYQCSSCFFCETATKSQVFSFKFFFNYFINKVNQHIEYSIQDVNSTQEMEKEDVLLKVKDLQEHAIVMNSLSKYQNLI